MHSVSNKIADLAGRIKGTGPRLKLYGTSQYLKYDHVKYFCVLPSIKTESVFGEGTLCCLIAVDHHKRCQTGKWLLESYNEFFAFLDR